MTPVENFVDACMLDSEAQRRFAGAAIAQFLVMREGLKGRMEDGILDEIAATLTAAIIAARPESLASPTASEKF
jgi:hypothetical protein